MLDRKITLSWTRRSAQDINSELQWMCDSLGLFPNRDYNSSLYRLFIELIKDARTSGASTSDELAARIGLTRGTVVHHLNKLMGAGIVVRQKNSYVLKERSVSRLIKDLRSDVDELFDELEACAQRLDTTL